jgi:hypothetical protein
MVGEELNRPSPSQNVSRWLGRESSGEPVQMVTETADFTSELRRGLSFFPEHGQQEGESSSDRSAISEQLPARQ